MDSNALLTEGQAAIHLQAKASTLTKWRCRKRGPAYFRIAGKVRYRLSDLEAFIMRSRVDPNQESPRSGRRTGTKRGSR
jgi:hypothetical protein